MRLVFSHLAGGRRALDPAVTWLGWHAPSLVEAGVIVAPRRVLFGVAIWEFSTTE